MCKPVALLVSAYFIYTSAELFVVFFWPRISDKAIKKFLYALHPKCRAKEHREYQSFLDSMGEALVAKTALSQIFLHKVLTGHSGFVLIESSVFCAFYKSISKLLS